LSGKKVTIDIHWKRYNQTSLLRHGQQRLDNGVEDFLDECKLEGRDCFKFKYTLPFVENTRCQVEIFGKLWYLPFNNGKEQRPLYPIAQSTDLSKECVIRCYWQNRLVPFSVVNELPLFKSADNQQNVSKRWKRRVVGILLFDWNFENIANNKLKFTTNVQETLQNTNDIACSIWNHKKTFKA
jgi:hypothetical protein